MREQRSTKASWWPALIIIGAACIFCWPVFLGRIMLPADMCLLMLPWRALRAQFPDFYRPYNPMLDPIQQYLPWRIYAVESLRAGFIPLWNPYAYCGTPFLANLQSTILYPLNLLFLLTGARRGSGISAILHLTLGGLFMYAFLRTLALRRPAALAGALILMFNGFTVTWLEFPTLSLWVFMWLPALLLSCERAVRRPRSLWPVLCALVLGLQFLGGHLQVSAYVVIAFLLYALVRAVAPRESARARGLGTAFAVASLALGLALAAAQILPTLELAEQTGRAAHSAAAAIRTAFPLTHFILYFVPNFFGNPVDYNYWGNFRDLSAFNFFETACYVGIIPLFLAICALPRWREREVWFFGGLAAFAVLAATGSPLYLLLYYLAPGFRELAGLGRVLCLAAFAFAGLAALGLDHLLAQNARRPARLPLLCAALGALAVLAAVRGLAPYSEALPATMNFACYLRWQVAFALALIASSALLIVLRMRLRMSGAVFASLAIALLILDLFAFGIRFNPFVDPRTAYPAMESTRWLAERADHYRVTSLASDALDWMPHNSPMIFGLRDIHGSDSLRVRRSFELAAGPHLDQAHYPAPDSPLLDVLGVRYLITDWPVSGKWKLAHREDAPIYESDTALPRPHIAHRVRSAGDDEALAALQADSRPFWLTALASPEVAAALAPHVTCSPAASRHSTSWFERDAANAMEIGVDATDDGLLVIADSYYPGWRARLDGRPASIYRVNYAFRGIPVPAGRHTVALEYQPATFCVGLFISLLSLAFLAAAGLALYLLTCSSAPATASRS